MNDKAYTWLHVFADRLCELGESKAAFHVRTAIPEFGSEFLDIKSTAADRLLIPVLRRVYGQSGSDRELGRLLGTAYREFPELGMQRRTSAAWLVKPIDPPARAKFEDLILDKLEEGVFPSPRNLTGEGNMDGNKTFWRRELLIALGWQPPGIIVNPLGVEAHSSRWWPAQNFLDEWQARHNMAYPNGLQERRRGPGRGGDGED